ncbi:hypothetical protein P7C71_g1017, partial [Lecanoromycetidae sp. Uapishka_2]
MAPSDEETDRQRAHDDAANPFISFRRFADEQMSNLMHNVFGLSSTSPDRRIQDYQTWLREARESRDRLNRETEEADRIMDLYTKAHKEGQDPAQEEIHEAIRDYTDDLRCPYRPAELEMPFERPRHHSWQSDSSHPSTRALFGTPLHREIFGDLIAGMPIAYLLYSPYSPVKLEQEQALRDHGIDWREAFEDLVATQKGQEMPPDTSHRTSESSTDWVQSMMSMLVGERKEINQKRDEAQEALREKVAEVIKEMPELLCSLMHEDPRQTENDATEDRYRDNFEPECTKEEEQPTELDIYNHFLGREQPSGAKATARSVAHLQHETTPAETDNKKPSILSTLTTTERTTLQDGTVHTKTVLKKRFSDGREVETETVHTQSASPQKASQQNFRNKNDDGEGRGKTSKGWFWS